MNYVSENTKRRLIHDITNIYKNPLADMGIYYQHDDENMLRGYAMIIGPKDTPYEDGFYFFSIKYPYNYPQNPPTVKYMTNNGGVRFNPNLYVCGKVCISILNTWKGEGWTSCQTIRSMLLSLVTVLNEKPLLNEPGFRETHPEYKKYNRIIEYKNLEFSLLKQCTEGLYDEFTIFLPYINNYLKENKAKILTRVKELSVKYPEKELLQMISPYRMKVYVDYPELYIQYQEFFFNY